MRDPLFAPLHVGSLELPNRIVLPAMHLAMARTFQVTDPIVDFYARRAQGQPGLIVVGYATIDLDSGNPTNIGAHADEHLPGLSRLAAAIRAHRVPAAIQLNHAGRYNHSVLLGGRPAVAPSAVACKATRETPRALEEDQILAIVEAFGQAARRVADAGFDAVEILVGTGYLVSQFLSPYTNRRTDGWGGDFEARSRFGVEVLRAVRRAVGPRFPVLARVNGNDMVAGGIGREDLLRFSRLLVAEGVDALDVNVGWHESQVPQIAGEVPAGAFAYLARGVKEAVDVPVIAGHRIDDPDLARALLSEGACDAVAMGRALIADPDLPTKAREGREREVLHCVACGQGCLDAIFHLRSVRCLVNPEAGQERRRLLCPAPGPGPVVVVGGGPAGLCAAETAAKRGFSVTLLERETRLGGQLHLAGACPGREGFTRLAAELAARVAALGVQVRTGCEATVAEVLAERPAHVILATGARPVEAPFPCGDGRRVVQAWDVLAGRAAVGRRAVVVGGNAVGVEVALLLAEQGAMSAEALRFLLVHGAEEPQVLGQRAARGFRQVTVVEMSAKLGADLGKSTRWGMLLDLERAGVEARRSTRAIAVDDVGVHVEDGAGRERALLPADTVVLALGARSHDPLGADLAAAGVSFAVAGDAARVADALKAVHAGYEAAWRLGR